MLATADFEVKISSSKDPSCQPMRAVQTCWISAEHLVNYGACFPEEVHFLEEQPIARRVSPGSRLYEKAVYV
jgi:hypothetical protein